jgi:microcystin-dependent protein
MPTLSVTKTYQDGNILTEADLDNIRESLETFFNTTGIDSDNIQSRGVGASNIGTADDEYIALGTSSNGDIGVSSGKDFILKNTRSDKDLILYTSPGGVLTETLRLVGANTTATVAATDEATAGSVVRMATLQKYVPSGIIVPYSGTSAPAGWLLCDGSAVSRTTYAALYAVIGNAAGYGNNATTFNVPDMRGRFFRGWNHGQSNDPDASSRTALNTGGNTGDNLFSYQADAFKSHTHTINLGTGGANPTGATDITPNSGAPSTSNATGGNETRPVNVYVNYIIKT